MRDIKMEQENVHTRERLKELQALPIERKIQITQSRIIEWYKHYDGKVYVSFSGGKDSTILLHIARELFPDIEAVYVDTGLEYPEIKQFVKSYDNVTLLRPDMSFNQVLDKYGYPIISKEVSRDVGRVQRNGGINSKTGEYTASYKLLNGTYLSKDGQKSLYNKEKWNFLINAPFKIGCECCDVMKKRPLHQYDKISGKKPITGVMADESLYRQKEWLRTGCNAFDNKNPQSKPMSFWTEQDVLLYIKRNKEKMIQERINSIEKKYNYSLEEIINPETGEQVYPRNEITPICSIYGDVVSKKDILVTTGVGRSGCIYCGFGCHLEKSPNRFERLKITHPKIWDYCIRPKDKGGLGMGEVLDFINVPYGKETDIEKEK